MFNNGECQQERKNEYRIENRQRVIETRRYNDYNENNRTGETL